MLRIPSNKLLGYCQAVLTGLFQTAYSGLELETCAYSAERPAPRTIDHRQSGRNNIRRSG